MTRRLMREVIEVAQKSGVPLEDDLVDRLIERILGMQGIGSSMQKDCIEGRPLELDVILGVPVKKAREFGISTPTLETIFILLLGINKRLENAAAEKASS